MKQLLTFLVTALFPVTALALPLGNPEDASLLQEGIIWDGHCDSSYPCANWCDAWSLRIGFYGDYVYNRHLKLDKKHLDGTIHRTEIYTNALYLAYNAFDRFDIFSTLGATSIRLKTPRRVFNPIAQNDYLILETETTFSYSIGARATLWECRCFGIGAETQYFYTRPNLNFVRDEGDVPQYGRKGDRIVYHEYQIGFGAAYRYTITSCCSALVPYVGLKGAWAWMDSGDLLYDEGILDSVQILNLKNDRYLGYVVGVTLVGSEVASVTIEGRFNDERALHVNAQFRF